MEMFVKYCQCQFFEVSSYCFAHSCFRGTCVKMVQDALVFCRPPPLCEKVCQEKQEIARVTFYSVILTQ